MCGSNSRAIVSVYVTSYKIRECSSKDKFRKYKSTHRPPTKTRRRKALSSPSLPFLPSSQQSLLGLRGSHQIYIIYYTARVEHYRPLAHSSALLRLVFGLCVEVSQTNPLEASNRLRCDVGFECNVIQFWTIVVGRVSIREFLSHSDPPPKFAHFNL